MVERENSLATIRELMGKPTQVEEVEFARYWREEKTTVLSSLRPGGPMLEALHPTVDQVSEGTTPTKLRVAANSVVRSLAIRIYHESRVCLNNGDDVGFMCTFDIGSGVGIMAICLDNAELGLIGEGETRRAVATSDAAELYGLDIPTQTFVYLAALEEEQRAKQLLGSDETGFSLVDYLAERITDKYFRASYESRRYLGEGVSLGTQVYKTVHKFLQREYSKKQ